MTAQDNPYSAGSAYQATVNYSGSDAAPAKPLVSDVTTANFAAEVIQDSRNQPVLVDFWAPWCGPCRQLAPALEKVVGEAQGRVRLVKMNIDDHPSIAGQLGIQSIPAVIAFKDGQPVDGFMGAQPESKIREFIERIGGAATDPFAEALTAAAEALGAGDSATAAEIYGAVLEQEPGHAEAAAALAGMLIDAGQNEQAAAVLASVPPGKEADAILLPVRARLTLAEAASGLGDLDAALQRVAADPADHQNRFDLALLQNAAGRRDEAADSLLAIIRVAKEWNEGAARAQLLKFFESWGMSDASTLTARRKLSSLLFS